MLIPGMELRVTNKVSVFMPGSEVKLVEPNPDNNEWRVTANRVKIGGNIEFVLSAKDIWTNCKPMRLGQLPCCEKCGEPLQPYYEESHYEYCK